MKRLISLVLVAALSFFSFMVYAEEPFAPIYIMSTINLREGENYSFNGDGIRLSGCLFYSLLFRLF